MSKKKVEKQNDNISNVSQSPDQQELLVLEDNYKIASVINYHVENIVDELKDLTSHFFKLGYHLSKLKESWDENLAKSEFYKFCEEKFLLKSTSIKNFINVYKSFRSDEDEDEIDKRFVGFSFTALVELLPLADDKEFAKEFKQLSTREIKKVVVSTFNHSELSLFMQTFELIKTLLSKKNIFCTSIELDGNEEDEDYLPSGYFNISYSNSEVTIELSLGKGVDYYGDKEKEVFHIRQKVYLNSFEFWYSSFNLCSISEIVNKLADAIIKYAEIHEVNDNQISNKVGFIPTGCAKRLGLKKKELIPYVDNPENYCESLEIHGSVFHLVNFKFVVCVVTIIFGGFLENQEKMTMVMMTFLMKKRMIGNCLKSSILTLRN